MSDHDPLKTLVLELALAVGMIVCLVGAMYVHTGSMPPLVVVESSSMVHEIDGEVGSIDAGDLILVHDQPASTIVTFAEATDPTHPSYGYEQHGLAGDVIIYEKNGEEGTPSSIVRSYAQWPRPRRYPTGHPKRPARRKPSTTASDWQKTVSGVRASTRGRFREPTPRMLSASPSSLTALPTDITIVCDPLMATQKPISSYGIGCLLTKAC